MSSDAQMTQAPAAGRETVRLEVKGMHCASCVSRIEDAVGKVEGVDEVSANLATGVVTATGTGLDREVLGD